MTKRTRSKRAAEERIALALTDNIPVGTYALRSDRHGNQQFTFVSKRWLKMLGLKKAAVMADHSLAIKAVHPEDRSSLVELNKKVFKRGLSFRWEGRILVRGKVRWVAIESVPRPIGNAETVWEGVMIDVTERKLAEEALRASEASTRRIFNGLPFAVACNTLGKQQKIIFLNELFTKTFGYTLQEIPTVKAWAELAYPDPAYRRETFRWWDAAVARAEREKGEVQSREFRVRCKDGTLRNVLINALVLDGMLMVGMLDVTERKLAEEQLRSVTEELERTAYELTENIPVGTYTMVLPPGGAMGYFSFMSTRFLQICGLDREAAKANPFNAFACVHPDDYDRWVNMNAEVFAKKLPFYGETRVVVRGEVRWISAESIPRQLPNGSTVWEGVLIDITDRKLAEEKLRENERELRKILDNVPIPIACNRLESTGETAFVNQQFVRSFGYTREDVPTIDQWARLAYPDAAYRKATFQWWNAAVERAVKTRGSVESREFRITCKDRSTRDVIISAVVLEDMLLVTFLDITARKAAEAALADAREREKQAEQIHRTKLEQKLKTSLTAAAVAHEINQPLSAILLNSQLAMERLQDSSEASKLLHPYLTTLVTEAQRVVSTTEKMKVLLRNVQTEHRLTDLGNVIHSSLLQAKKLLSANAVSLRTKGLEKTVLVQGDGAQLQLAVANLLRNAVEALAHKPKNKRRVSIELRSLKKQAVIIIGDSGPGFPKKQALLPLETTKPQGTGIGLYVVRTAMENHGGQLIIGRSELGGAEVRLLLPRHG